MLRKRFYPYECINDLEKFKETLLPEKEDFYSYLNMEDITDADYKHTKRFCKDFRIKFSREFHDLHVQGNALLLADVFQNFQNMCLKIYELNAARIFTAPGLTW